MSLPIRHLPVIQNWDCHTCGQCCREYDVAVTKEERERIESQGWQADPDIGKTPLFVPTGMPWSGEYRLNHKKGHGCIFLTEDNLCKIHAKFGEKAKPLGCRLFPFVLVPTKDHWRVGVRFACPSAARNAGTPTAERAAELAQFAHEYEVHQEIDANKLPMPRLQGRQQLDWPDCLRIIKALQSLLGNREDRLERRWRKCLALAGLCRQAKFDVVKGKRLDEFLALLGETLDDEVPAEPADVPAPRWIGRILFRQLIAMYGRKDRGVLRGLARRGRIALLRSGWRFSQGTGKVPQINARIRDVTFEEIESQAEGLTPGAEEILERYYSVKLNSLQFFGPTNFRLGLWDGLDSLALTFPIILWLARAVRQDSPEEAVTQSVSIVDDHFGYNPILRTRRYQFAQRILAGQGELPRLIAWYARERKGVGNGE